MLLDVIQHVDHLQRLLGIANELDGLNEGKEIHFEKELKYYLDHVYANHRPQECQISLQLSPDEELEFRNGIDSVLSNLLKLAIIQDYGDEIGRRRMLAFLRK